MKNFQHILVPTDFSESSSHALDLALELATAVGAELTLLHVWEIPVYPYNELILSSKELMDSVEKAAAQRLASALEAVQRRLPRAQSALEMGIPWQQIIDSVPKYKADLVVMGTHGRRGLSHLILGSVAEKVVRLSPVPVLTARSRPASHG